LTGWLYSAWDCIIYIYIIILTPTLIYSFARVRVTEVILVRMGIECQARVMEVFVQMKGNKIAEGQSYELLGASEKVRPFASFGRYECSDP
jgi:hypothetical protein